MFLIDLFFLNRPNSAEGSICKLLKTQSNYVKLYTHMSRRDVTAERMTVKTSKYKIPGILKT